MAIIFRTGQVDSCCHDKGPGVQGVALQLLHQVTQGQGKDHQACGGPLSRLHTALYVLWKRTDLQKCTQKPYFRCPYKTTKQTQNAVLTCLRILVTITLIVF